MVEHGTIIVVDQATRGVHGAPIEAIDGHSGRTERIATQLMRKDRASRQLCSKVNKESQCTMLVS